MALLFNLHHYTDTMDAVMGGKILELASERIRREVAEEYAENVKDSEL